LIVAVTGTLNADFSQFQTAVQKAEVSLRAMEGGAVKVEAAVSSIGEGTAAPLNSFRDSIGQVDQALAASGVQVGKYVRAIDEIGAMAGKTVGEVGLLATASSMFAAGMAGYQFGTWIAGFTGLDKAVLKFADSLTNISAEVAGAKMDTINLAIRNGADATITYTEAVKFNTERVKDQNAAYAVSSERLAAAQAEVRGLSDATIDGIAIAQRNKATTEEITRHFHISADALRALAERQKQAGKDADAHTQALEKQQAAVAKLDADYAKLMSDVKNANQLAIMEAEGTRMAAEALKLKNDAAAGWIAQQVKVKAGIDAEAAATAAYLTEQDALTAATDALGTTHTLAGVAAVSATAGAMAGYAGVAQQVQISGDAIKEWIKLMQYSAQVNAILHQNSLFTTTSQLEQIAGLGGGGRAGGSLRGGGTSVVNNFHIVDTEANIARRVSDRITESVMRMGPV
jgi:uncharacterized tellurite resistance protein B-like protein